MEFTLEELMEVNKRFGGTLVSNSSIDFALDYCRSIKSNHRQTAMLIRAIVVDHPFTDANKRTALYVIGKAVGVKNQEKMANAIIRIAKEPITDLDKIIEVVKNANR